MQLLHESPQAHWDMWCPWKLCHPHQTGSCCCPDLQRCAAHQMAASHFAATANADKADEKLLQGIADGMSSCL